MISDGKLIERNLRAATHAIQTGEVEKSRELCDWLLERLPNNADVLHLKGLTSRALGELPSARLHLERAAALSPLNAPILSNLGLVLLELAEAERAKNVLVQAVDLQPEFTIAHANLGHVYLQLGDLPNAEKSYRKALDLNPLQADALCNLVQIFALTSRLSEFDFDIENTELQDDSNILSARGILSMHNKQFENAVKHFESAISLSQPTPPLLNHLASAHVKLGHTDIALSLLRKAIDIAPNRPESYVNAADVQKYTRPEEAIPLCAKALELESESANTHDLMGFLHFMTNRNREAIEYFDQALQIDPTFLRAAFHKAGTAFVCGDFGVAWKAYVQRYGPKGTMGSPFPTELPSALNSQTVGSRYAVWTDQGLGDEILQLGIVSDLFETGELSVLSTSSRLVPIAERTFPGVCVLPHDQTERLRDPVSMADTQCPAIGLGQTFRRSWDDFPKHSVYLNADMEKAASIRRRYTDANSGKLLAGLSWKSTNAMFGAEKSIDLNYMLSFFSGAPYTWVSLQYGDVTEDIRSASADIIYDREVDPLRDLDTFAAQIQALDLVITTSNTTAHMAGALGKPTLALIPRRGPGWLWYWFDDRTDSPWYPSMTLFRQSKDGNWAPALSDAAQASRRFLEQSQRVTTN